MSKIKYYKRNPHAALEGMMELSLEERGAYNTILDLIYARADQLLDDDQFIAGWLRCDVRVWKRIKGVLITLGKIRVESGFLRNNRATSEIDDALDRIASSSQAGVIGAAKRWGKSSDNMELELTPAITPAITNQNHIHKQNNKISRSDTTAARKDGINGSDPDPLKMVNDDDRRFDIEHYLDDSARAKARSIASGWDLYALIRKFNDFVAANERPRNPVGAFLAWIPKFTKDKPP